MAPRGFGIYGFDTSRISSSRWIANRAPHHAREGETSPDGKTTTMSSPTTAPSTEAVREREVESHRPTHDAQCSAPPKSARNHDDEHELTRK